MHSLTDCIEWLWCKSSDGYGKLTVNSKSVLANREAYIKANGLQHSDIAGKVIRHTCDNRGCVNPEHLLVGTQADNISDMVDRKRTTKGRSYTKGCDNGASKLTDEVVYEIRSLYRKGGLTQKTLALRYSVTQQLIHLIVSHKAWRHLE